MPFWRHLGKPFSSPAGYMHHRLAAAKIRDGHVLPRYPHSKPRTQRLGTSFFCRPTLGIGSGDIAASLRFTLFDLSENPVAKTISKTIQGALNSLDVAEVCADTEDHAA